MFDTLGLRQELLDRLRDQGFSEPLPIQKAAIPPILDGKDVICNAPTGTGKTLAYLLPILSKVDLESRELQCVVIAPSQELAMQIARVTKALLPKPEACLPLAGAGAIGRQVEALKNKPVIAVGTPGRIAELISMRKLKVHTVKTVVIDEADKMMSSGFAGDASALIKAVLRDTQLVFVSATINQALESAIERHMKEPEKITVQGKAKAPENITHYFLTVRERDKILTIRRVLEIYTPPRAVVFISRNEGVPGLVKQLAEFGLDSRGLHSDLPDVIRKKAIEEFRSGECTLLATTDIFSRGLDIPELDIVFNYDLPTDDQHYIHRSGRTGRAGRPGMVVSLVSEEEKFIMKKYEKRLKVNIAESRLAHKGIVPIREVEGRSGTGSGRKRSPVSAGFSKKPKGDGTSEDRS